jgi:hypothetical protein
MTRRYPSRISKRSADMQLTQLLYGCTDERLRGFTAASLVGMFNVSLAVAEAKLAAARVGRGL